jgi:hypothetical protein
MRVAVLLVCMALFVAATAVARGFGLLVFLRIPWDACCVMWSVLKFFASWIVPHWLNHALFWLAGYCISAVFWVLNFVLFLWESGFDLVMYQLGHQPSAAGGSITQLIDHSLGSLGIGALLHILYQQFNLVPQAFAEFCSSFDNMPNVVLAVAIVASFHSSVAKQLIGTDRYDRLPSSSDKNCECIGVVITGLLFFDIAAFALLVSATLLPLLCIFAVLTLAAGVIHYFRPGIRPKHSAPCLASLAAM